MPCRDRAYKLYNHTPHDQVLWLRLSRVILICILVSTFPSLNGTILSISKTSTMAMKHNIMSRYLYCRLHAHMPLPNLKHIATRTKEVLNTNLFIAYGLLYIVCL